MWGSKKRKNFFSSKKYRIVKQPVKYLNPFNKKRQRFQFKPMVVINLILLMGIGGFIYFFIFSNFYNVTDIQVSGNEVIATDDVLDITGQYLSQNQLFILKNRNIFLFSKNAIKKRLNEVIILEDLKVDKILPNTIKLTLVEKNSAIKWLSNDNEYLLDNQGQIIKRYYVSATPQIFVVQPGNNASNTTPVASNESKFIKLRNLANQPVNLGDYVIKAENAGFILELANKIKDVEYLKFTEIDLPNAYPQYLSVIMAGNWQIQLNLLDSVSLQLNRLNLLIDQKIKKENLNRLEYIDLRLGESIYYKFKEQPESKPAESLGIVP
jgi:cell division septal protein FtsQ